MSGSPRTGRRRAEWGEGATGRGSQSRGSGPRTLTPLEELGHILVAAQGRVATLGVQADEHVEQRLHAQGALVAPGPVQEQLLQLLEPHLGRHGAARPAPNAPASRRPLGQSVRASPQRPGGREPRQPRPLVAAPSASSRPGLGRHLGLGPGGAASGAPGPAGPWAGLLPSAPPPAPASRSSAPPAAAPSSPPAVDLQRRGAERCASPAGARAPTPASTRRHSPAARSQPGRGQRGRSQPRRGRPPPR